MNASKQQEESLLSVGDFFFFFLPGYILSMQ